MIGKIILHYKIKEKLGEGGMGVVYLAEDNRLKRDVAIKFLPGFIAGNSDERKRFEIEAQAAAALNHAHISHIYAIEETENQIFIVMEYIKGKELKEIVNTHKANGLPVKQVIDYASQIAEGIEAAHEKNIVHRDIKSTNIMITDKGKAKIMDFGLAKFRGSAQLTQIGTTIGTAAYMSPEQARGEEAEQSADIWSFGVVLYEMFSGQLPFKGDYEQAVIYGILNEKPQALKNFIPDMDERILNLVDGCLQKDTTNRYQSFQEIIDIIKTLRDVSSSQVIIVKEKTHLLRKPLFIAALAVIIIAAVFIVQSVYKANQEDYARAVVLPQIENLVNEFASTGEGPKPWQAFNLLNTVSTVIPDDPLYKSLFNKVTHKVIFKSKPENVQIYAKSYTDTSAYWLPVGQSPVDSFSLPVGFSILKFEKPGFKTAYDLIWNVRFINDTMSFMLVEEGKVPENMSFVSSEASWFEIKAAPASLHFPGLEQIAMVKHDDFFMDKFEVSNKDFKEFVDAGGYQNPEYWKYPFDFKDRKMDFNIAMELFTDRTGRQGPATWEVGDYPSGQADLPVAGVSWFEAAAYAEFKGKSLPSIFHWDRAAFTWASPVIIPSSNIRGKQLIAANDTKGINRFGVYNMAGNVREWCINESSRDGNFIVGGGWDDPAYGFNDAYAQSPFDRSPTNGFRCIKYIDSKKREKLAAKIELPWRDFLNEKPVSDATFAFFLKQYAYDKAALNSEIESTQDDDLYTRQLISFDAAYGGERMMAYIFLPKNSKPPFQTIVYFPGSGSIHRRSSENLTPGSRAEFILKSGRAFVWPVYKSTYERGDGLVSDYPEMTNYWKDHIIMWTKDFSRTIDYLETRDDIINDKIAYYGASWGGALGGIIPAVEKRIRGVILLVAGLQFQRTLPEVEAVNYLPRITQPVIMLNGRYDFFFPYESAQLPFYKLLGTPEKDKRMFVHDGGHTFPKTEQAKEVLKWLDQYFGKVGN